MPTIWVIGSDWWQRAYLRAELIERGYDAVGIVTMREAILRLMLRRAPRPALIVCDLHEQALDERLAGTLIREGVPVVAIGGAREANDETLGGLPWATFLRRPVTIGAVADAVGRLAGSDATQASAPR